MIIFTENDENGMSAILAEFKGANITEVALRDNPANVYYRLNVRGNNKECIRKCYQTHQEAEAIIYDIYQALLAGRLAFVITNEVKEF